MNKEKPNHKLYSDRCFAAAPHLPVSLAVDAPSARQREVGRSKAPLTSALGVNGNYNTRMMRETA